MIIPRTKATCDFFIPVIEATAEKILPNFGSVILLRLCAIRKLIDHREICVKIPAKIAGISNTVCKIPVTAPAINPPKIAQIKTNIGLIFPSEIKIAQINPPSVKLPSTVISGISSNLNVIYTPSTIIPHNTPWDIAPKNAPSISFFLS